MPKIQTEVSISIGHIYIYILHRFVLHEPDHFCRRGSSMPAWALGGFSTASVLRRVCRTVRHSLVGCERRVSVPAPAPMAEHVHGSISLRTMALTLRLPWDALAQRTIFSQKFNYFRHVDGQESSSSWLVHVFAGCAAVLASCYSCLIPPACGSSVPRGLCSSSWDHWTCNQAVSLDDAAFLLCRIPLLHLHIQLVEGRNSIT